jgi:3-methyladenine DNA glycosylase AlkD
LHPEHQALLKALRAAGRPPDPGFDARRYLGSDHVFLNVTVPARRSIAKAWLAEHKGWGPADIRPVIESLFEGASHEEKTLAAMLIACSRPARQAVRPQDLDGWLGQLVGWAEVDNLCQNVFPPEQMLADWPGWKRLLETLAGDPNINKRRAALVLLTAVVRRSPDPRLSAAAFQLIEPLKSERAIIITKAISWLLRGLLQHHAGEVVAYLDAQGPSLPAIAVRETRTKLATGAKGSPRKRGSRLFP